MEFVRIFADVDCLLSVKYDHEQYDEFEKLFYQWNDIEYLDDFFSNHKKDLDRPFWKGINIEQAIIETRDEANKFRTFLKRISELPQAKRISVFISFFKPLSKNLVSNSFLDKKKAYGKRNKISWLRIYALKAGDDMYIITGGAIKLTDNMKEREHTANELKKLEACKQFLLTEEGIVDEDGMIELLEI